MANISWDTTRALPTASLLCVSDFRELAAGLDHPTCVASAWDGTIYAGGEGGQVYRVSADGTVHEIANTGGFILGIVVDGRGTVYVTDAKRQELLQVTSQGEVTTFSTGAPGRTFTCPGHITTAPDGSIYVADAGHPGGSNGGLFRVATDGTTTYLESEIRAFPCGIAIHPDAAFLYVVEGDLPGVRRMRIAEDGSLGYPELVIELPHQVPSGLAFDRDGCLYISCYAPSVIYRVNGDGEVSVVVSDWSDNMIAAPTGITFGGNDRELLVASCFKRWHLAATDILPGGPLDHTRNVS